MVDKAVKLLAISIFCKKYFRNLHVITKIMKILYYENLEPYGIIISPQATIHQLSSQLSEWYMYCCSDKIQFYCYSLDSYLSTAMVHKPVFVPLSNKGWKYACINALMIVTGW